jgi:hypothetical protein
MKLYEKVEMIYNAGSFSDVSIFPPVVHFVGIIISSFSNADARIGLFDATTVDFHPNCGYITFQSY